MQRIVVLGAGFAGLWSALGAACKLDELGIGADRIEILVVNRTPYHSIRVRDYEADLSDTIVPLADVLDPVGVKHLQAEVTDLDVGRRMVICGGQEIGYDRLVFALGSYLARPPIPGLQEHGFDVDTYEGGTRLNAHIAALPSAPPGPGQYTALVVGAGLTGVEAATEMLGKLRAVAGPAPVRVILADRQPWIGSDMGENAKPVIAEALQALGIETRVNASLASLDAHGAALSTGERIETATIVWCAGLLAHPLTARFPAVRDRVGRLPVDHWLKIEGQPAEFAAGDAAWFPIDGSHPTVMSCQHARPMGRFAGHNVVCDLLGLKMLPLRIDWYATVLDLGPWGAVHTEGWDRQVVATGEAAKRTKQIINCERIYPPRTRIPADILAAAAATVQAPPPRR